MYRISAPHSILSLRGVMRRVGGHTDAGVSALDRRNSSRALGDDINRLNSGFDGMGFTGGKSELLFFIWSGVCRCEGNESERGVWAGLERGAVEVGSRSRSGRGGITMGRRVMCKRVRRRKALSPESMNCESEG
jgi:hypothetical protein